MRIFFYIKNLCVLWVFAVQKFFKGFYPRSSASNFFLPLSFIKNFVVFVSFVVNLFSIYHTFLILNLNERTI